MNHQRPLFKLLAACVALGCEDPLDDPQVISGLRVLAARVEPVSDPGRASVQPGEAVTVRFLVVAPGGAAEKSFGLLACVAAQTSRGVPRCQTEAFARVLQTEVTRAEPFLSFVVPDTEQFASSNRVSLLGVFCTAGRPVLSEQAANLGCTEAADLAQRVSYDISVSTTEVNRHPDLANAEVKLDGDAWGATNDAAVADAGCEDMGDFAPQISAARLSTRIEVTLPPASREALAVTSAQPDELEVLQISHFSDLGRLERPFSSLSAAQPEPRFSVEWQMPAEPVENPSAVHFFFVVRDGRGGSSWLSRVLCLVP